MKTTIMNVFFLISFALAASSTPITIGQSHAPRGVAKSEPPHLLTPLTCVYIYEIDKESYTEEQLLSAIRVVDRALSNDKFRPPPETLAKSQKLVIESTYLEDLNDPDFHKEYDAYRSHVHQFMLSLIVILQTAQGSVDPSVLLLARKRLQIYLNWEIRHFHGDIYPTEEGHRPLNDEKYLKELGTSLRKIIDREIMLAEGNNKHEMKTHLNRNDVLNRVQLQGDPHEDSREDEA
ncbi:hypothetical protein H0H93_010636, partial [Arthromyces matolae]